VRGHDHSQGREKCRVCGPHDHSDPDWRELCPECGAPLPDLYEWSRCAGCDGSGWVPTHGFDPVRPCLVCNEHLHSLWEGGHFAPGHRCDVCSPPRGRRPSESSGGVVQT
jgi:hypothetical protein